MYIYFFAIFRKTQKESPASLPVLKDSSEDDNLSESMLKSIPLINTSNIIADEDNESDKDVSDDEDALTQMDVSQKDDENIVLEVQVNNLCPTCLDYKIKD